MGKKSLSTLFLVITIILQPCLGYSKDTKVAQSLKDSKATRLEMLTLFGDVLETIKQEYVEPVEDKTLIESAINGMLTSLDPHSSYLDEKSFEDMKVQTRGEFGGLGIEITLDGGLIKVVSPIDGTPAYRAGIKAGDYISHINDEAVTGMTLTEAVDKMRGKVGTKVNITILREGATEPLELTIIRDVIKIQSVKSKDHGDVAYIRISSFSEQTSALMKKEILKIKASEGNAMKGIVLDLRNNPGGLLDQAVEVSDAFLQQGEIVTTRGRDVSKAKRYNATKGDLINGLPIVVLINNGSASASEIVAGALQDHRRALVVGIKSFGKGSVQTVRPLSGNRAIRITTSRYYTPSGRSIQAEGIEPDIIVEQAKLELITPKRRFSEASLPNHLQNTKQEKEDLLKNIKKDDDPSEGKSKDLPGGPIDPEQGSDQDYQLQRAMDLVRGLWIYQAKAPVLQPRTEARSGTDKTKK